MEHTTQSENVPFQYGNFNSDIFAKRCPPLSNCDISLYECRLNSVERNFVTLARQYEDLMNTGNVILKTVQYVLLFGLLGLGGLYLTSK